MAIGPSMFGALRERDALAIVLRHAEVSPERTISWRIVSYVDVHRPCDRRLVECSLLRRHAALEVGQQR